MNPKHLFLVLAWLPLCSLAGEPLPADVARFADRRDLCDHFRGEEPYDATRRKTIERGVRTYCTGTDKRLAALKLKYKTRPEVMERLGIYEARIEQ